MTLADALDRIKSFVGTRYDGKVVQALVEACSDGQIGVGVVRLRTNAPKVSQTHSVQEEVVV